jgi:hypothetical protein
MDGWMDGLFIIKEKKTGEEEKGRKRVDFYY